MYHICAIIKDEHLFLREWIEYHLSIGFDSITLYEDFTSKSHRQITDAYPQVILKSMRDVPECKEGRTGRQIACYHDFLRTHSEGWCAFIDIDEFFRIEEGWTLDRLTKEYADTAGLCLWWKCYGANGHITRPVKSSSAKGLEPQSPVQESYSANTIPYHGYWQFKSFVNITKAKEFLSYEEGGTFINCHYHRFICHFDHTRADFRQNRNKKHICYSPAWIDHYITKSWEDWQARLKRGNITKGIRDEEFFFKLNPDLVAKIDR